MIVAIVTLNNVVRHLYCQVGFGHFIVLDIRDDLFGARVLISCGGWFANRNFGANLCTTMTKTVWWTLRFSDSYLQKRQGSVMNFR